MVKKGIERASHRALLGEGQEQRLASLPAFEPRISTGYLERYSDKVSSTSTCAVFSA
jgi:hypothetical protein